MKSDGSGEMRVSIRRGGLAVGILGLLGAGATALISESTQSAGASAAHSAQLAHPMTATTWVWEATKSAEVKAGKGYFVAVTLTTIDSAAKTLTVYFSGGGEKMLTTTSTPSDYTFVTKTAIGFHVVARKQTATGGVSTPTNFYHLDAKFYATATLVTPLTVTTVEISETHMVGYDLSTNPEFTDGARYTTLFAYSPVSTPYLIVKATHASGYQRVSPSTFPGGLYEQTNRVGVTQTRVTIRTIAATKSLATIPTTRCHRGEACFTALLTNTGNLTDPVTLSTVNIPYRMWALPSSTWTKLVEYSTESPGLGFDYNITAVPVSTTSPVSESAGSMLAGTPTGKGWWTTSKTGGVFSYGTAAGKFHGSLPGLGVSVSNVTGIAASCDGGGYWLVGADGGVFAFGDAWWWGSLPGDNVHVTDIVGIEPTPDCQGYYLIGSDGGVFAFGDAEYQGSLPADAISLHNIVALTVVTSGYYLVGADGGVFAFGAAWWWGSLPNDDIVASNIIGLALSPSGNGYYLVGSDGGVFAFGDANYVGSKGGEHSSSATVGMIVLNATATYDYVLITQSGKTTPYPVLS